MAKGRDFSALRFLASVGEPLNAECVVWGNEVFGRPPHDNWWQSETGGIMIANTPAIDIKPGSMGRPLPGIEAGVVAREDGALRDLDTGEIGELALRTGWPSMMRGYLKKPWRGGLARRQSPSVGGSPRSDRPGHTTRNVPVRSGDI